MRGGYRTTTYVFEEVAERRTVEIECSECGLPRKRTLRASQTINPFNKNADGSIKTRGDIYPELDAELDRLERELKQKAITCKPCQRVNDELQAEE